MIPRRHLMQAGAAAAALAALPQTADAAGRGGVDFSVPAGATDCHVHVFPDPVRYPFFAGRTYTPPIATAADLARHLRRLKMDRVVIVQPSVYGTDNRATLDGIRQLGLRRARGVAVIGPDTSRTRLDEMQATGIRGVRVNLETAGVVDPAASAQKLKAAVEQIAGRGWHVQTYTRLSIIEALKDQLMALPVPLVVDHFGGARGELGTGQPGFAALVELVRAGRAYVKISGAYRSSTKAPDYAEMTPFAQALIAANPERIVWGSDWPHPNTSLKRAAHEISEPEAIEDVALLNQLPKWAPDAAIRRKILVENPARLYGFS